MNIAVMKDGQIVVGDYRSLFPNTSFPASGPSAEWIAEQGWPVTVFKAHDRNTQKLVSVEPYIEDGQVFTISVEDKTQDELASETLLKAGEVRKQRGEKLKDSDWTQLADSTADKTAWAEYRQALRDISLQEGFPWTIEWPTEP
jgi:hypothetical protein